MRQKLADKYISLTDSAQKEAFIDSASIIFSNYLLNEIIPYWYGTVWDFDGYVMAERAETSDAFWSEIYYLTKITGNKELIEHWLLNKEVKVILDKQVAD